MPLLCPSFETCPVPLLFGCDFHRPLGGAIGRRARFVRYPRELRAPFACAIERALAYGAQMRVTAQRFLNRRHHFTFTNRPFCIVPSAYQVCGAG